MAKIIHIAGINSKAQRTRTMSAIGQFNRLFYDLEAFVNVQVQVS